MEDNARPVAVLNRQKFEREYIYDGVAVLNSSFQSYVVDIPTNRQADSLINGRIGSQLSAFMKDNLARLFPDAVEAYKQAVANGYPVRAYESVLNYTATYNAGNLLSMYRDQYEYAGGAHGSTVRRSDTFSLQNGRVLPLSAFFPYGYDYTSAILQEILAKAKEIMQTEPVFFDNYEELIVKNFNPQSYYLTQKGIAIYYQQYDIAPYSTGIVVFEIPYDRLNIIGVN